MYCEYRIQRVGAFFENDLHKNEVRTLDPDEDANQLVNECGLNRVFWTLYGGWRDGGSDIILWDAISDCIHKDRCAEIYSHITGHKIDVPADNEPILNLPPAVPVAVLDALQRKEPQRLRAWMLRKRRQLCEKLSHTGQQNFQDLFDFLRTIELWGEDQQ